VYKIWEGRVIGLTWTYGVLVGLVFERQLEVDFLLA
jgi:hypothetical protein